MFYTYVFPSLKDKRLYAGYTPNLKSRAKAHANGFVKATKYRRPLKLIYYEAFINEKDAKKRELYLKSGNGKRELEVMLREYFKRNLWDK